jgi:hypothetical protein
MARKEFLVTDTESTSPGVTTLPDNCATPRVPDLKPDWLPNWIEPRAYPDPHALILNQWAWEFLRRNPRYQQDWAEKVEPVVTSTGAFDNSLISKELDAEITAIEEKYGIMMAQDPREGRWPPSFRSDFVTMYECPRSFNSVRWAIQVDRDELYVKFNLRRPIGGQIEEVRGWIENRQRDLVNSRLIPKPRRTRQWRDKWPMYLRVLDARAAGASLNEIAGILVPDTPNSYPEFKGRDAIRKGLTAARRLRDGGYLHMLPGPGW